MSEEHELVVSEVRSFVDDCIGRMRLELSAECRLNDTAVTVLLSGEDKDLVLRENARVLYALNHLINQAFFRRHQRRYSYWVDCDDYRSTRVLELQLLAEKAAERVRVSGEAFRLQPMPSSERRVIHLALAETEGVRTASQGGGSHRRVVIEPA